MVNGPESLRAIKGRCSSFGLFKPNTNYVRNYRPKETFGPPDWRRMVYANKVRMEKEDVFGALDIPDGGQTCPKRGRSTTAVQALNLFNSAFVIQQATLLAARVAREAGDEPDAQVRGLFQLALARAPDSKELAKASKAVREHGLATLCRVVFNTNEFLFMP